MVCKGARTDKQNTYFKRLICNRAGVYQYPPPLLLSCLGFKKKIKTKVKKNFFRLVFMALRCLQNDTLSSVAAVYTVQQIIE